MSVRRFGLERCSQRQASFFNVSADRLPDARKELGNGNPENFLVRECGRERRQPMSSFIPRNLSTGLATQEKSNLALSEAGFLAVGAEIVFESWSNHLGIEIADQCDCLPLR